MKLNVSKTLSVAVFFGLPVVATTILADGIEDEAFVYMGQKNEAVAACLIGTDNSSSALATCLCQASGDQFAFCSTSTITTVSDPVAFGFGDSFGLAETNLSTYVRTSEPESDIRIAVNASCTLKQGRLALQAIESGPPIDFLLGAISQYGAVYMWPEVNGVPVADPIRLCARGNESLIVESGGGVSTTSTANDGIPEIEFEITHEDISMAGGFQWVAENVGRGSHHVAVKFIIAAAVENHLLQALGTDAVTVGVLAEAKLEDRVLHAVGYDDLRIVDAN